MDFKYWRHRLTEPCFLVFPSEVLAGQGRVGFKIVKVKVVEPASGFVIVALHPHTLSVDILSCCSPGPLSPSFISTFGGSVLALSLTQFRIKPLLHS